MSTDASSRNVKDFAPGAIIAEEGSPAGGWYVLLSGHVAVTKKGFGSRYSRVDESSG